MRSRATAVAIIGGLLLASVAPSLARAADEPLVVSDDGEHWSTALDTGAFPTGMTLIPGGEQTATIWVMSTVDGTNDLTIELCNTTASSDAFANAVSVSAATDSTDASIASTLAHGADCAPILAATDAEKNTPIRVSVSASMSGAASTLDTTAASASFDLRLTLTERIPETSPTVPASADPATGQIGVPSAVSSARESTVTSTGSAGSVSPSIGSASSVSREYSLTVPANGSSGSTARAEPDDEDTTPYPAFDGDQGAGLLPVVYVGAPVLVGLAIWAFLILGRRRGREHDETKGRHARKDG